MLLLKASRLHLWRAVSRSIRSCTEDGSGPLKEFFFATRTTAHLAEIGHARRDLLPSLVLIQTSTCRVLGCASDARSQNENVLNCLTRAWSRRRTRRAAAHAQIVRRIMNKGFEC